LVSLLFGPEVLETRAAAVRKAWADAGRGGEPRIVTGRYLRLGPDADRAADDYIRQRGRWPRAVALLVSRQSLEEAIDELWAATLPAMETTSARAQLLCLPPYLGDDETAADAAHTWGWLSRVCHHRAYEVAPTGTELEDALRAVRKLVTAVDARTAMTGAV
jgi:hypothetical protein